jgi:hypothetical protein
MRITLIRLHSPFVWCLPANIVRAGFAEIAPLGQCFLANRADPEVLGFHFGEVGPKFGCSVWVVDLGCPLLGVNRYYVADNFQKEVHGILAWGSSEGSSLHCCPAWGPRVTPRPFLIPLYSFGQCVLRGASRSLCEDPSSPRRCLQRLS